MVSRYRLPARSATMASFWERGGGMVAAELKDASSGQPEAFVRVSLLQRNNSRWDNVGRLSYFAWGKV